MPKTLVVALDLDPNGPSHPCTSTTAPRSTDGHIHRHRTMQQLIHRTSCPVPVVPAGP
jgi:hypothetical protein